MNERVAMIGLDAAEWWIVQKYIDEGVMPNVEKLLGTSRFATLGADDAFKAEGRWTEILTGRTAEENQYWSIVDFDPTTYTPWYQRSSHGTYFFARPDLRSIVFDVPNSVVAEDAHGIQVTAWGSHAAQFPSASQPSDVLPKIDRQFGVHEALLSDGHNGWHNDTYLDTLQDAMEKGLHQKSNICRWLEQQCPDWQLFFVVLGETHVAEHQYLHGILHDHPLHDLPLADRAGDRLRRTFAAVDETVGELVDQLGEDVTIVLFAGHGMEANTADVAGGVLLPELLHRRQFGTPYLEFPDWSPGDPYLTLDQRVLPRHFLERCLTAPTPTTAKGRTGLAKRVVRRIRHHLPATALNAFERTYWHRPNWWEMHLRPAASETSRDLYAEAARLELESVVATSWYRPHWGKMKAFVIPSFSDCHIRINLKGREAHGIVEPDDYEAVLDEVEADLRKIVDARTGEPVVDYVIRMRAKDPNASIGPAPDLVVSFKAVTDVISHPEVGVVGPAPLMRMGEHTPNGWAAISTRDGVRADLGAHQPRDLTATVIELLGLAPSPLVTGTSFAPDVRSAEVP